MRDSDSNARAGHTGEAVRAPADWPLARGVGFWAGPRSLPLWAPAPSLEEMLAASNGRASSSPRIQRVRTPRMTMADITASAADAPPSHAKLPVAVRIAAPADEAAN